MSNVLAFLGVVCILIATVALTSWKFGLLGGGVVLLAAGYAAHVEGREAG